MGFLNFPFSPELPFNVASDKNLTQKNPNLDFDAWRQRAVVEGNIYARLLKNESDIFLPLMPSLIFFLNINEPHVDGREF
jgi:hypothetical protein